MGKYFKFVILIFIFNISCFGEVSLKYDSPKKSREKEVKNWLIKNEVFENLVKIVNSEFIIKDNLVIFIKSGDSDTVYYDPYTKQLFISYEFILEVEERFRDIYDDEWELYSKDAIEHTFYHEFGHALIDILDIPVLGKEEDAVDDFGVLMLLLTTEDGDERSISAAELFFLEGLDRDEVTDEDLMDVHSLDDQRGYRILSLIYGSNPEKYDDIATDLNFDENTSTQAEIIYHSKLRSWLRELKPYLKDGFLLQKYNGIVKEK